MYDKQRGDGRDVYQTNEQMGMANIFSNRKSKIKMGKRKNGDFSELKTEKKRFCPVLHFICQIENGGWRVVATYSGLSWCNK